MIDSPHDRSSRWRIKLALALWVGGFFLPLAIPLVIGLPLPLATKTALSGLLVLGLPQLLTVIAITLIGRSGFHYFKAQLLGAAKIILATNAYEQGSDSRAYRQP